MNIRDIIPEYLLKDRDLLAVYCDLLRRVQARPVKVMAQGKVIPLAGYELLESTSAISERVGLSAESVNSALGRLSDLDVIEEHAEGTSRRIRFLHLSLPETHTATSDIRDYNDCYFEEFAESYLEYVSTNLSKKTRQNASRVMGLFSRFIGRKKLGQLRPEDLEEFKRSRKGKVSDATINIDTRTLKAALELSVSWGRIPKNVFRPVKLIRQTQKKIRPLTREEFKKLSEAIQEKWLLEILRFAVLTGLRRGEIMDLKWKSVDLESGSLTVESSDEYRVKHGKIRTIPLGREPLAILKGRKGKGDYVFTDDAGSRLRDEYVSKKVKAYMREAHLDEELHFHSLRATYASWVWRKGMSQGALKELMGHGSTRMTEHYASMDGESLRKEVDRVSDKEAA